MDPSLSFLISVAIVDGLILGICMGVWFCKQFK